MPAIAASRSTASVSPSSAVRSLPSSSPAPVHDAEREQPCDRFVDQRLVDVIRLHRGEQLLAAMDGRSRHLEIEAGKDPFGRGVEAEPVGHHDTVEAPFVAQDAPQQFDVVGGVRAVDPVVRAHHRPDAGLLHGHLEREQVQLA